MTHNDWKNLTAEELRIGAKVARAHGGMVMPAAAESWERRADLMDLEEQYPIRFILGAAPDDDGVDIQLGATGALA